MIFFVHDLNGLGLQLPSIGLLVTHHLPSIGLLVALHFPSIGLLVTIHYIGEIVIRDASLPIGPKRILYLSRLDITLTVSDENTRLKMGLP